MCYKRDRKCWNFCEREAHLFSFLFLQYWGLNSGPSPWDTLLALFLWWVFSR
jgi:hypothetical protein